MLNWINKKRNKKGFTLIELIVVIAILGILAAIAIPRLGGFTKKAEDAAVEATDNTLISSYAIYMAEEASPVAWNSANKAIWGAYLNEWPEGVTSVQVDASSGDITVTRSQP